VQFGNFLENSKESCGDQLKSGRILKNPGKSYGIKVNQELQENQTESVEIK